MSSSERSNWTTGSAWKERQRSNKLCESLSHPRSHIIHGTSVNPTYFNCMYVYVRGSKHVGCRTLQLGSSGSSYTEASG